MKAPDRFEEAVLAIGGDTKALLDAAEASLQHRRRFHPWMTFNFAGRRWWIRHTSWRLLVFLQRGDETALCERWHD